MAAIEQRERQLQNELELCPKSSFVESEDEDDIDDEDAEPRRFECIICFKQFDYWSVYEDHMRVHSEEKPQKCEFPGCKKNFKWERDLKTHTRKHVDEYHCTLWYPGDQNPLQWMHDAYRAARWPDAPSWHADKAMVILRASRTFSDQQVAHSNPRLMSDMSLEVSSLFSGSRSRPLQIEFNEIEKGASKNVLGNKVLNEFLRSIPDLGVALLVINGPECLSLRKLDWEMFARKYANLTIYIACCIHIEEGKGRVIPYYREDGSYTKVFSDKRAWTVISMNRLLEVWEGVVEDSHYEFFLGQLKKALAVRDDGSRQNRNTY